MKTILECQIKFTRQVNIKGKMKRRKLNLDQELKNKIHELSEEQSEEYESNKGKNRRGASQRGKVSQFTKRAETFDSDGEQSNSERLIKKNRNTISKKKQSYISLRNRTQKKTKTKKKKSYEQSSDEFDPNQLEQDQEYDEDDAYQEQNKDAQREEDDEYVEQLHSKNRKKNTSKKGNVGKKNQPSVNAKVQLFDINNTPSMTKFKYNNFTIPDSKIYEGAYEEDSDAQLFKDDDESESQKEGKSEQEGQQDKTHQEVGDEYEQEEYEYEENNEEYENQSEARHNPQHQQHHENLISDQFRFKSNYSSYYAKNQEQSIVPQSSYRSSIVNDTTDNDNSQVVKQQQIEEEIDWTAIGGNEGGQGEDQEGSQYPEGNHDDMSEIINKVKNKIQQKHQKDVSPDSQAIPEPKRKRGRPRKYPLAQSQASSYASSKKQKTLDSFISTYNNLSSYQSAYPSSGPSQSELKNDSVKNQASQGVKIQAQQGNSERQQPKRRGRKPGWTKLHYMQNKANPILKKSTIPSNYYEFQLCDTLPIYANYPELFETKNIYIPQDFSFVKLEQELKQKSSSQKSVKLNQQLRTVNEGQQKDCEVKINFEDYCNSLQARNYRHKKLIFQEEVALSQRKQFQRDLAIVFSSGGYGIAVARNFFGPKLTFTDYNYTIKKILFNTWKTIEEELFYSRVNIYSMKGTFYPILREYLVEWKASNYLDQKQAATFRKCIRIAYKFSSTQRGPSQQQLMSLYQKVLKSIEDKLIATDNGTKRRRKDFHEIMPPKKQKPPAASERIKGFTPEVERQAYLLYIETSVEKKNLTMIRQRILDRYPQIDPKEFLQDWFRNRFRNVLRRSVQLLVEARNRAIMNNPSLDLPMIKKVDQNKMRLIIHGLDATVIRVTLLKFYLDQDNIDTIRFTIEQLNKIEIPGQDLINKGNEEQYQTQPAKRGRKRKIQPNSEQKLLSGESRVKEQFDDGRSMELKQQAINEEMNGKNNVKKDDFDSKIWQEMQNNINNFKKNNSGRKNIETQQAQSRNSHRQSKATSKDQGSDEEKLLMELEAFENQGKSATRRDDLYESEEQFTPEESSPKQEYGQRYNKDQKKKAQNKPNAGNEIFDDFDSVLPDYQFEQTESSSNAQ